MMTFRRFLLVSLVAMLLLLSSTLAASAQSDAAPKKPPNVLLIISDDHGWPDYHWAGHPHIQTPHIDQLAREGMVFRRGYVPDSLCRPSLATILTGLYPRQHQFVGNDPPLPASLRGQKGGKPYQNPEYMAVREEYIAKIDKMATLPRLLKPHGYRSFQSGKWWEGSYQRGGFDEGMTHGDMKRGGRHGDAGLAIGREGIEPIDRFIGQCAKDETPFFVWYAPMMPHTPHDPPDRLLRKYLPLTPHAPIAKYWAMCEWFDETIGSLRQSLTKHGVADQTLIVYVCDNGWINDPNSSQYAPKSKRSPNEGGCRTPILFHQPSAISAGVSDQLASSIDLVPTILSHLGQSVPSDLPGIHLLDPQERNARTAIFGEIFQHDIVSMDDPVASLMHRWVIEGEWKLIEDYPNTASVQLYHVTEDPEEKVELSAQHPDRVASLKRLLLEHWDPRQGVARDK